MFKTLKEDIQNIFAKDPTAKNTLEVILCYPGLHAIWIHLIAHWFYRKKMVTIFDYLISLSGFIHEFIPTQLVEKHL